MTIARQRTQVTKVEELLWKMADPNAQEDGERGRTTLFIASGKGLAGVVNLLCHAGVKKNQACIDGITCFW